MPDPDNEEVIITGGNYGDTETKVSVYSEAGWKRDLAPLNHGRRWHACGGYINGGKKVKSYCVVSYMFDRFL